MKSNASVSFYLPSLLTMKGLKAAFERLPLVASTSKKYNMIGEFRPPEGLSSIKIDASQLSYGTPEALASLAALIHWLCSKTPERFSVDIEGDAKLHKLGLDPSLSAIGVEKIAAIDPSNTQLVLPVHRIILPNYSPDPGSSHWKKSRELVQSFATTLSNLVNSALTRITEKETIRKTVAEFLWEGLLNVQEHAYDEQNSTFDNIAWVSAAIYNSTTAQNIYRFDSGSPTLDETGWLKRHYYSGATHFLEIALIDAGVGIPNTLGNAFLEVRPDLKKTLNRKSRRAYWNLHDEVLKWALSPYGSRKPFTEYETTALAAAWRGLYRVLYRTNRSEGSLILRSGFGMIGTSSFHGVSEELSLRKSRLVGLDEKPWPWTSLVLRLALPFTEDTKDNYSHVPSSISVKHIIDLPVEQRNPSAVKDSARTSDEFLDYHAVVEKRILQAFEALHASQRASEHIANQLVLVIHPAISLGLRRHNSLSSLIPDDVSAIIEENEEAAEIIAILGKQACPGIIPIHIFIDISPEALDLARSMFAEPSSTKQPEGIPFDKTPSIVGVVKAGEREIGWFIEVTGSPKEMDFAKSGQIDLGFDEPLPDWLEELINLYPGGIKRRVLTGKQRFELLLPSILSVQDIKDSLNALLPSLATERQRPPWFWEAQSEQEFVITGSGQEVDQYVSAFGLCVDEPVIEDIFVGLIKNFVFDNLQGSQRALIIPAWETSSYLLAKRFVNKMGEPSRVIVVHPNDLDQMIQDNDQIFVFADVLYSGLGIERRLVEMKKLRQNIKVIVCLDLSPRDASGAILKELTYDYFSLVTWPFPVPRDASGNIEGTTTYVIDPLTNEVLETQTVKESKAYISLIWQDPASGRKSLESEKEQNAFYKEGLYEYGFQAFGERLHVVRCPVKRILKNRDLFLSVVEWIAKELYIEGSMGTDEDVVLFARDESNIYEVIFELARGIIAWQEINVPTWAGRMYIAPVLTTRHGERQILRYKMVTGVNQTIPVNTSRTYSAQQLSFFSDEHKFEQRKPYHAVFLDNGSITGRALRDFSLAMTKVNNPPPIAIHLFPLINKLSPTEERLLLQIPYLKRDLKRDSGDEGKYLLFHFHGLLQLRIRSYRDFESTSLFRFLDEILDRAQDISNTAILEWAEGVRGILKQLSDKSFRGVEQYPLYNGTEELIKVSLDSILFRHLLSLYQQGLPVLEELVKVLRKIILNRDRSLLIVFALEPDLWLDSILLSSFATDISDLALETLEGDNPLALKSNALWVLFIRRRVFVSRVKNIARSCVIVPDLRSQFMTLLLAGLDGEERQRAIDDTIDVLKFKVPINSESKEIVDLLRAESHDVQWQPPKTQSEARSFVYRFMRESRARHGDKGFSTWWRFHNISLAIGSDPLYIPPALELSETIWDEANIYLETYVLPVLHSLSFLSRQKTAIPRGWLLTSLNEIKVSFERARRLSQEVIEGIALPSEFRLAWEDVCWNSLQSSVDQLLGKRADCILGEATEGIVGSLDYFLPWIVLEPVALLYHTLGKELGMNNFCLSKMSARSHEEIEYSGSIDDHIGWLYTRWKNGPELPLFWADPQGLRQCYKMIADNIRIHGKEKEPLDITMAVLKEGLTVTIKNPIRPQRRSGGGDGLEQIKTITALMGGSFTWHEDHTLKVFEITHAVPIAFLQIPALGNE